MTLGATKLVFCLSAAVFLTTSGSVHHESPNSLDKDEYEDVPDRPFPGKIQIMPIVQRDAKHKDHKGVSETVQEIIRELPNDEQYERIGKMLNNSYDAITREMAEGKTAIRKKMVMAGERSEKTNSAIKHAAIIVMVMGLSIIAVI